jgi:hypothetical protein
MTYKDARLAEFNAMAASGMYGSSLSYGGADYACVADVVDIEKMMAQAGWQPESGSKFTMRATDWTASGMTNRSVFTYELLSFEIYKLVIDPKEPTVSFTANLKK